MVRGCTFFVGGSWGAGSNPGVAATSFFVAVVHVVTVVTDVAVVHVVTVVAVFTVSTVVAVV